MSDDAFIAKVSCSVLVLISSSKQRIRQDNAVLANEIQALKQLLERTTQRLDQEVQRRGNSDVTPNESKLEAQIQDLKKRLEAETEEGELLVCKARVRVRVSSNSWLAALLLAASSRACVRSPSTSVRSESNSPLIFSASARAALVAEVTSSNSALAFWMVSADPSPLRD